MCFYDDIIAKPPFTKPPFVNSRATPSHVTPIQRASFDLLRAYISRESHMIFGHSYCGFAMYLDMGFEILNLKLSELK